MFQGPKSTTWLQPVRTIATGIQPLGTVSDRSWNLLSVLGALGCLKSVLFILLIVNYKGGLGVGLGLSSETYSEGKQTQRVYTVLKDSKF